MRASSAASDDWVLSPAFVNAHSHMEYRGMLDQLPMGDYLGFIRAIMAAKEEQTPEQVEADCLTCAQENRESGIAWMAEHADRPGSSSAFTATGLRGHIYHEVIALSLDQELPEPRHGEILNPHATYTVREDLLRALGKGVGPRSIHVSESTAETDLFQQGSGMIADWFSGAGVTKPRMARSPMAYLDELGFLKPGRQMVHCCDIDDNDIALMADRGVDVAHCPRSNVALNCPIAPVRRMREAGIPVGIGLDSPASGGPVDMFAEMREALASSRRKGEPLTAGEVWTMATTEGAKHFGEVELGWIRIEGDFDSLDQVIEEGSPERISWVSKSG